MSPASGERSLTAWLGQTSDAIKIVAEELKRGALPITATQIPLLECPAWLELHRRLQSYRPESVDTEADALLLVWTKGWAAYRHSDAVYSIDSGRLLKDALACGTRTRAFVALAELADQLDLTSIANPPCDDYPAWLDHRFKLARIYKRQGRFSLAMRLTAGLAKTIPTNRDRRWRSIAESKVLLHTAKAASSYDMRLGLALALSRFSTARLRQHEHLGTTEAWMLARSIDTQLGIEFDLLSAQSGGPKHIDRDRLNLLLARWQEAEDLDELSPAPTGRTAFRRCRARFESSIDQDHRESCRISFREMLSRLPSISADVRGQAIREGHYADMLMQLQYDLEARVYLDSSIANARTVCDWQAAAINLLRKARLVRRPRFGASGSLDESLELLADASNELSNLEDTPVALFLAICRDEAQAHQLAGNWKESHESLDRANEHLRRTLRRLNTESADVLFRSSEEPNHSRVQALSVHCPTSVLSDEENGLVSESLAADWSILTAMLVDVQMGLSSALRFRQRNDTQRMSWQRLERYGALIAHKIKNHHNDAMEPLRDLTSKHSGCGECLGSEIREAIEASRTRLLLALTSELRLEGTSRASHFEMHSVQKIARIPPRQLEDLRQLAPGLEYEVVVLTDFRIDGFEPELRLQLFSLLENAARVMGQGGSFVSHALLCVRIEWQVCSEAGEAFGVLEIADSGGRANDLICALNEALEGPSQDRWHGLSLAVAFFKGEYSCRLSARHGIAGTSILRIEFPSGARVQP